MPTGVLGTRNSRLGNIALGAGQDGIHVSASDSITLTPSADTESVAEWFDVSASSSFLLDTDPTPDVDEQSFFVVSASTVVTLSPSCDPAASGQRTLVFVTAENADRVELFGLIYDNTLTRSPNKLFTRHFNSSVGRMEWVVPISTQYRGGGVIAKVWFSQGANFTNNHTMTVQLYGFSDGGDLSIPSNPPWSVTKNVPTGTLNAIRSEEFVFTNTSLANPPMAGKLCGIGILVSSSAPDWSVIAVELRGRI